MTCWGGVEWYPAVHCSLALSLPSLSSLRPLSALLAPPLRSSSTHSTPRSAQLAPIPLSIPPGSLTPSLLSLLSLSVSLLSLSPLSLSLSPLSPPLSLSLSPSLSLFLLPLSIYLSLPLSLFSSLSSPSLSLSLSLCFPSPFPNRCCLVYEPSEATLQFSPTSRLPPTSQFSSSSFDATVSLFLLCPLMAISVSFPIKHF